MERAELVQGYEIAKGQYIRVTDAELESLEAEADNMRDSGVSQKRRFVLKITVI